MFTQGVWYLKNPICACYDIYPELPVCKIYSWSLKKVKNGTILIIGCKKCGCQLVVSPEKFLCGISIKRKRKAPKPHQPELKLLTFPKPENQD